MYNEPQPRSWRFIGAMVASVLAAGYCTRASAEDLVMATWGGGVERVWEEAFAKPFEEKTGISVKIVPVPSPEAQIRTQAGSPLYDVAIVTYPQGANLNRDGLIAPIDTADVPSVAAISDKYTMKTKDGKLVGISPYFMYYAIAFNNTQATKEDFNSWRNLADPKWKGRLAITRPVYIASYDLPIMAKATGGSEKDDASGIELLKKVIPNTLTSYSSIAHMNTLLTSGQIAAGPYYSGRVWQMRREGAPQVDMVIPEEGALMIPYIVVVPKGVKSEKSDKIRQWLDYIAEAEPQERAAALGGYLPLNSKAVLPPKTAEEMGINLKDLMPRLYQPDWAYIAETSKDKLNEVEKIIADAK